MWVWYFPSELWLIVWAVDTFVVASLDAGVLSEVSLDKGKAHIYTFPSSTIHPSFTTPFPFPSHSHSIQCKTKDEWNAFLMTLSQNKIHNLGSQVVITDKLNKYCHCELLADLGDWLDVADVASDNCAWTWTTIAHCKSGERKRCNWSTLVVGMVAILLIFTTLLLGVIKSLWFWVTKRSTPRI